MGSPFKGTWPSRSTDAAAAVVVIQEWWGVNNQIRGVADRLASAGYVALVPRTSTAARPRSRPKKRITS